MGSRFRLDRVAVHCLLLHILIALSSVVASRVDAQTPPTTRVYHGTLTGTPFRAWGNSSVCDPPRDEPTAPIPGVPGQCFFSGYDFTLSDGEVTIEVTGQSAVVRDRWTVTCTAIGNRNCYDGSTPNAIRTYSSTTSCMVAASQLSCPVPYSGSNFQFVAHYGAHFGGNFSDLAVFRLWNGTVTDQSITLSAQHTPVTYQDFPGSIDYQGPWTLQGSAVAVKGGVVISSSTGNDVLPSKGIVKEQETVPASKVLQIFCTTTGQASGERIPCAWTARLTVERLVPDPAVHTNGAHIAGTRPLGGLAVSGASMTPAHRYACLADDVGVAGAGCDLPGQSSSPPAAGRLIFVAPEVSGQIRLRVDCTIEGGSCVGGSFDLNVRVPDLFDVRTGSAALQVVPSVSHAGPVNHWGVATLGDGLRRAAGKFRTLTGRSLFVNDVGLPWGGLVDKGNWTPVHTTHRYGIDADIKIQNFSSGGDLNMIERLLLDLALRTSGLDYPFLEKENPDTNDNHWHVRVKGVNPPSFSQPSPSTTDPAETDTTAGDAAIDTQVNAAPAVTCPAAPNRLALDIRTIVERDGDTFLYRYQLTNRTTSELPLRLFELAIPGAGTIEASPAGWTPILDPANSPVRTLAWAASEIDPVWNDNGHSVPPAINAVRPGETLTGFAVRSTKGPGTVAYAAYGQTPPEMPVLDDDLEAVYEACATSLSPATGTVDGPGPATRYLAEGATGPFFDTRIALFNPNAAPVNAILRFLTDLGETVTSGVTLPSHSRRTVLVNAIPGLASANFSTVVESDSAIVVDRTMTWGGGYGSHAETSLGMPSDTWYLAEGSTSGEFALFYLLQNPHAETVTATIRYLRPFGLPPIERTYTLPPSSRTTIPVDGEQPELANTDVSGTITANRPIIAERAMYRSTSAQIFAAGHGSAGVTAPSTTWFLAEGATGPFFDLFILLANPMNEAATIDVDYLLSTGETYTKTYTVPANGRFTIFVDEEELPGGTGLRPLRNVAVSSRITSTNGVPIIVERTMWWPSPEISPQFWTETHNSPGVTSTGIRWALAEGEQGGPQHTETYVLIANTSAFAGTANVSLFFEDGGDVTKQFALKPNSRTNVQIAVDFPEAAGRRFSTLVESVGTTPAGIVVERAMYTSSVGVTWDGGTNALGSIVP
jgi:hypothetical protein